MLTRNDLKMAKEDALKWILKNDIASEEELKKL